MFFRNKKQRQTYLHYSPVYDSGNKTAATGFKLTLKKREREKKREVEIDLLKISYHDLLFKLRVRECSPAVCLVRFVLWEEGKVGTQNAPWRVQPSSPDPTAGSRNSELDLQVCFPKKQDKFSFQWAIMHKISLQIFADITYFSMLVLTLQLKKTQIFLSEFACVFCMWAMFSYAQYVLSA